MRIGERPGSIRAIAGIRDDKGLQDSAAGQKVRMQAGQVLMEDPAEKRGISVNVGVGVGVNLPTPGYVIDLSEDNPPTLHARTIDHELQEPSNYRPIRSSSHVDEASSDHDQATGE